jgi:uncharacterized protein YukE
VSGTPEPGAEESEHKGGLFSTVAGKARETATGAVTGWAVDKAKEAVFGKEPEADPHENDPAGPDLYRRGPVYGPPTTAGDAYGWTRAACRNDMPVLPEAQHPSHHGLTGWLDDKVESALKASGLLDMLEKVTGNLAELNAAAEEWQAQARAVQNVADALRAEACALPQNWEGTASDAFGRHMGEVVQALDSTAAGMYQTAQIISQAAQMCALAEGMVIDIIGEAIEALVASLAAEAVIAVLTLGVGLIADAMLDAAEIAAFVARVAKVSEELAANLEKLLNALKELGAAVKEARSLEGLKKAADAFKEVRTAAQDLRKMEEGGDDLVKVGKDALKNKSLDGVGRSVADFAVRKGAKAADDAATDWAKGEFKQVVLGDDKDDSVSIDGRFTPGSEAAPGQPARSGPPSRASSAPWGVRPGTRRRAT